MYFLENSHSVVRLGVDFTNLPKAFARADPKSTKRH